MLDTTKSVYECAERHVHRAFAFAPAEERRLATDPMLAHYLEGWAEADPAMIADATTDHYEFHDPLVGRFSKSTLPRYFALLRSRFASVGVTRAQDLIFTLRGPMPGPSQAARRQYWREAPLLGLTGLSEIVMTHRGVAAEAVTYDLNVACEILRRCNWKESGLSSE
jgi:hypothetical protein